MMIRDISHIVAGLLKSQVDHAAVKLEQLQNRVINRAMLILAAVLLIIGGLGMIIYSIHVLLAQIIPPAASGAILGLTMILTALILIFITANKSKV